MLEVNDLKKAKEFEIFGEMGKNDHEQLVFCNDCETGLKAIIGIHNTVLGPSLGGTRMWNYTSDGVHSQNVEKVKQPISYMHLFLY